MNESRTKKTFLNARINLICYFASLITAFFTRKILLENLGAEFIGFTGTIGSLLGFLNLAELGIGTAIGYVLYKPIANKDRFKINEIISVLGYLYKWIGLAILGGGFVLSLFLPLIFPSTTFSWGTIYFGFYVYLAASLIGYFANYKAALLSADQRNYIVTGYFQISTTSKVIIQMILAIYFSSFILYFAIELLFGIINSIILNLKINQTYPWLKSEIKLGSKLLKKHPEISKYIKQIFAHKIGTLAQYQLSPFLIYTYTSLPIVALYTNYTILTQKLESLISTTINSTGAAIGNLVAEGNKEKTISIFKELLALRIFIATISTVCIYKFSSPFIMVWLGKEYILDNKIVLIITILSGLGIARGILDQFLHAYGLYADIWAPYVESAILATCSIMFGYYWGLGGVLMGPLFSIIIIIYIWKPYYLFAKGFKVPVINYWVSLSKYIIISLGTIYATNYIYQTFALKLIAPTNWGGLFMHGMIYVTLTTLSLSLTYYILFHEFRQTVHRIINHK